MTITIRTENPTDPGEVAAIAAVNAAAFDRREHGALPAALRATAHHRPAWCLVALDGATIVGHVMVGTAFLEQADGSVLEVPNLSPLAVAPARQRGGIGRALVEAALAAADSDGEPFVVLEGSPAYYGRLGFEDAREHGVTLPLPDWAPPTAGQLHPLSRYRRLPGTIAYPPAVQAAFDALEQPRDA
ncbi:GNAT family N-acetyltransferase [Pseudactinotalea terrae]|uniref:GNAT family N-acetyltransferase n=1 Tax=Pseudactinotalea terrae TaxID=1743262 RepID=UPI0012E1F4BD|nr:GNAT family N-acetyltransferase [Pseudactinotalea terrae]